MHNTFDMTTDEKFDYLTETMMGNFDRIYKKFDGADQRFDELENKMNLKFILIDQRFDELENKMDKKFDSVDTDLKLIKNSLNLIITHLEIKPQ